MHRPSWSQRWPAAPTGFVGASVLESYRNGTKHGLQRLDGRDSGGAGFSNSMNYTIRKYLEKTLHSVFASLVSKCALTHGSVLSSTRSQSKLRVNTPDMIETKICFETALIATSKVSAVESDRLLSKYTWRTPVYSGGRLHFFQI